MSTDNPREMNESEKPPLFNSWSGWYALVLGILLIQVIIYRLLTVAFS